MTAVFTLAFVIKTEFRHFEQTAVMNWSPIILREENKYRHYPGTDDGRRLWVTRFRKFVNAIRFTQNHDRP